MQDQSNIDLINTVISVGSGIAGAAIGVIRSCKKGGGPKDVYQIISSFSVAAFTSWLVFLFLNWKFPQVDPNLRALVLGCAGLAGERLLAQIEKRFAKEFQGRTK